MRLKNRRKYVRLEAYHLAHYKVVFNGLEKEDLSSLARVRNISAGGCCLRTDKFLPVGSILELKINFPHLENPVFALSKVVWTRQIGKTGRYEFGIQFIEIDENLRKFIDEHINSIFKIIIEKGGEKMKMLAKIFIILAVLCVILAVIIKLTTLGTILPAAMPINWIKLADTALLFAIALALVAEKAK
ncbi:MAG: PilZ domain-containing protein [Candidatus Omnitrophica bacterium]|nr:PilZ domain-containing protein [Candidatus Omnitrophota bacterium]